MEGGIWAFYYLQGEDGEDRAHPNAFRLAGLSPGSDVTLADVLRSFPLRNPNAFHFRFRLNSGKGNTFYWLDVTQPTQKVPLAGGRVICKLLRLERPNKPGLVFRRRPVLKWASGSQPPKRQGSSSALGDSAGSVQSAKAVQPLAEGGFHRSSNGAEARHSNASSHASSSSGEKKTVQRTGSGSKTTAPAQDFLSGGQQAPGGSTAPAPLPPKKDVNLMSDSGWNDAPATPAQPANANAFLNSMDPLAARAAPAAPASPSKVVQKDPPKFEDDNGQTVGPVTMAEMEAHSKSTSDGSNVYNPNLVDKSTKSEDVRRAMEERERQVQRDVEKAREELRKREEAKSTMSAMKDSANAVLGPRLKAWAEDNGRVKNIRTLLSTMHQVMWDDCKWAEVNMGKLIQPNDVKKHYRKAMIVVHPDKSGGRSAEQLLIAERVFAALNTAWEDFQKTNPC